MDSISGIKTATQLFSSEFVTVTEFGIWYKAISTTVVTMESIAILSYAKKDSPTLLYSRSFDSDNDINLDRFDKDDIRSM